MEMIWVIKWLFTNLISVSEGNHSLYGALQKKIKRWEQHIPRILCFLCMQTVLGMHNKFIVEGCRDSKNKPLFIRSKQPFGASVSKFHFSGLFSRELGPKVAEVNRMRARDIAKILKLMIGGNQRKARTISC